MDGGGVWTAVMRGYLNQEVFGVGLGVFDKDIKIAIFVKRTGVEQFVLELFLAAPAVRLH